ncbi:MAG TPA: 2-C-methyl-D-erythritol 2,4-cyclodiphosphate synthase [Bacilli bacterium]|nr:2-C-methyl-D-erythritol 2,4-cyclodiphosphate synthase [Bacilli bacterium]
MKLRIGSSLDIHRFKEGDSVILGGVKIPHNKSLLGHSDADVVLHVVAESILGALSLGDLGKHFPDTDPSYKGVSSSTLVKEVMKLAKKQNYFINNIDISIVAEAPMMAPHVESMRLHISKLLETEIDNVSVKATRGEKLGFIGREEGIMAFATVLMVNTQYELKKL